MVLLNVSFRFLTLLIFCMTFAFQSIARADMMRIKPGSTPSSVVIEVGREIFIPHVKSTRAADNKLVSLRPRGSGLAILGLRPGWTNLVLNNDPLEVHVLSKQQVRTQEILRRWVQHRLGLRLKLERAKLILHGRLLREGDWLDLAEQCSQCAYTASLQLAPAINEKMAQRMKSLLTQRGLAQPALRWNPHAQWILRDAKASPSLMSMAQALGITMQTEEAAVDLAPLIKTEIYVLEASREKTRQLGLKWPGAARAQLVPYAEDPLDTLYLTAEAAEREGVGKVLASPTLLCRSGEQAEFLAGGEFPIKIVNTHKHDVVWKKYGVVLKVKPRADRFGRMNISIETEVSTIDGSRTVDGIPGLLTNRVMSHFDLDRPRTIAISGLIKNEESRSADGLPGLMRIPVLGSLFSSTQFRENRSELLILVRPSVVGTDQPEAEGG